MVDAFYSKAHLGEVQKNGAKDRAGVGADLVGGVPQALFKRGGGGVCFDRDDPVQVVVSLQLCRAKVPANYFAR